MQLREAESNLLKAAITADKMAHWETSTEVLTAKRALASAQTQLAKDGQAQKDAKALFDKGIISRDEFDAAHDQAQTHQNALLNAEQALADVLKQGDADNKRIADLALQSARAHMDELKHEAQATVVRASRDGLLLRPPEASSSAEPPANIEMIDAGIHVTRGEVLFSLANIENYVAEARIDEVDVGKVRVGQSVQITSDSFPGPVIQGKIISVGVEADQAAGMSTNARYVVGALIYR